MAVEPPGEVREDGVFGMLWDGVVGDEVIGSAHRRGLLPRLRTGGWGLHLLERATETAGGRGVTPETAVATGKPARLIVDYAEEHDVDHIVLGSHGRRGLARVLIGSVAETVVRRSPASVTVIR